MLISALYKSISEKINEAQKLLNKSRINLPDTRDFASKERVYEPEIAIIRLCTELYQDIAPYQGDLP